MKCPKCFHENPGDTLYCGKCATPLKEQIPIFRTKTLETPAEELTRGSTFAVVKRYLDCGNPKCGFARDRCGDCGSERLLYFSCCSRGFCPSCHSKRRDKWGEC